MKSMARVSAVHIPYAGAAPAQLGLLTGQTDFMFDNLASAASTIRAGKLKGFAVTTRQRSAFFPELPTVSDTGLAGFDISTWFGIFAPAGTPKAAIDRLHAEFERSLASEDIRQRLSRMGADPAPSSLTTSLHSWWPSRRSTPASSRHPARASTEPIRATDALQHARAACTMVHRR